jgi:hypothetical protein
VMFVFLVRCTRHQSTTTLDQEQRKLVKCSTLMCGLISILSINGNRWLCIVVDDVSRLPFLFFMKNMDDAATYIKEYVKMVNM